MTGDNDDVDDKVLFPVVKAVYEPPTLQAWERNPRDRLIVCRVTAHEMKWLEGRRRMQSSRSVSAFIRMRLGLPK